MNYFRILVSAILLFSAVASCGAPVPTIETAQATTLAPVPNNDQPQRDVARTPTGFFWPTGEEIKTYNWLADSCEWSGNDKYFDGKYHTGADILAKEGDPVYAIADGKVARISRGKDSGWLGKNNGQNNVGVLVEHELADGTKFIAVYGHVVLPGEDPKTVEAGKPFASIGPYDITQPHLHFGVRPGTSTDGPLGMMDCPPPPGPIVGTNGFVDPIEWITTSVPFDKSAVIIPTVASTRTPPAPVPTPTPRAAPNLTSTPSVLVARVNKVDISLNTFQKAVRYRRYQLISQYNQLQASLEFFGNDKQYQQFLQDQMAQTVNKLNDAISLGHEVLIELIQDELIRQEAARRSIVVTPDELERRFQESFGYFPNGVPISPDAPTPAITPTPFTAEAYRALVTNYIRDAGDKTGLNEADIRAFMEGNLYREKVAEAITTDVPTVEEQVHARHILVDDEATIRIVQENLKAGEAWDALAAQYSTDKSNSAQGGDLGWFGRGRMVAEFEAAAFSTPIGAISEPIKTEYGWHLIQVLGREERPLSASEIEQKKQAAFTEWVVGQLDTVGEDGKPLVETYDIWFTATPSDPSLP